MFRGLNRFQVVFRPCLQTQQICKRTITKVADKEFNMEYLEEGDEGKN